MTGEVTAPPGRACDLLSEATARLSRAGISAARLEAEVLLAQAMDADRAHLYAHLRDPVEPHVHRLFERMLSARERRLPLAYVTGSKEFWSLSFHVTPDVLVPRPETELLVEEALRRIPRDRPCSVLDIGTGSGCLAVAIARERPAAHVTAIDISPAALHVAAANVRTHGVGDQVDLVCGDLDAALRPDRRFTLVVSNPPYVEETARVDPEVRHEPAQAVFAGPDGLSVLRRLVPAAARRLEPGGSLLVEIGRREQAEVVRRLAQEAKLAPVQVLRDLASRPRVVAAARPA